MICSMTGYATITKETPNASLNIELRAVNNRYLDILFRLPDDFRMLESAMRTCLSETLSRGKVECRFSIASRAQDNPSQQVNQAALNQLLSLSKTIQSTTPEAKSLTIAEILQWPGILSEDSPIDDWREQCMVLLNDVLAEFQASREREGEKLKTVLLDRLSQMRQLIKTVSPRIPELITAFEARLKTRLQEAAINDDDDRIRQELTIFAGKIDVDEELTRLQTHLDEVERILQKGGAVGKRLDFMMQELNREANTIGSKSVDIEISKISMELKVLIEQMREQVQNIE